MRKKIKDLCMVSDCLHVTPEYADEGYPMVRVSEIGNNILNLDNALKVSKENYAIYTSKYKPQKGDIILARVGAFLGQFSLVDTDEEFCIGQNTTIIHPNKMSKYIYYNLISDLTQKRLQREAAGSAYKSVGVDTIKNFEIDIPDERSAELIGSILYKIDRKIQINNGINDNLQQQLKVLYDYWFTQFDFPDSNGKPYKSSGGTMVSSDKVSYEVPDGWKVETLLKNSLSDILKPGVDYFTSKTYLATADVNGTEISSGSMIDYETRENRANMQPTLNSVWFAKMKNSNKHLYLNKEMKQLVDECILSTGFCGLKCTEESFEYISSFIEHSYFEIQKDTLAHGATQEAVNNDDLSNVAIVIPSSEVLHLFHQRTSGIYSQISKNICENQELTKLRDWLLPMLMNGQATIRD